MAHRIVHLGTASGPGGIATGIGDLAIAPSGTRLYTSAGPGGLATWAPGGGVLAQTAWGGTGTGAPTLAVLDLAAGPALLSVGQAGGLGRLYGIGADGTLGAPKAHDFGTAPVLGAAAVRASASADWLFTTSAGGTGIDRWQLTSAGTLKALGPVSLGGGQDLGAIASATAWGKSWIVAASGAGSALSLFEVGKTGGLALAHRLAPADGFFAATPTALRTLDHSGESFVIAGAAGSGSLVVLSIDKAGLLTVRDLVNDSLATRFGAVSAVEALAIGAHAFVAAAGADEGVSLFRLLPDGRLVHLASLADSAATALAGTPGLALRDVGGVLELFTTGQADRGTSRFRLDIGPMGQVLEGTGAADRLAGGARADVLMGGAGDDLLQGLAGDDVLVDGAGTDRMQGGAGADIFSLRADGAIDVILDFERGLDRLDLSDWGPIGAGTARIVSTATGADILWQNERLVIHAADRKPLSAAAFQASFDGLSHVDVAPSSGPKYIKGGTGADVLIGGPGADRIEGGRGGDRLIGAAGDDVLFGEAVDPTDPTASLVHRMFQAMLGREADAAGTAFWTHQIESGARTVTRAIEGFLNSAEFVRTYGKTPSAAGFVDALYQNVLGRPGEPSGRAFWTDQIESGARSRAEVVRGFVQSPEFETATALDALGSSHAGRQAAWADEMYRAYGATLGRAPDTAGLEHWTGALADGAALGTVIEGLMRSAEFRAAYGDTTPGTFVAQLYHNVLGRAPDRDGLLYWTGKLARGEISRAEMVEALAESPENVARTSGGLQDWMRTRIAGDWLSGGAGTNTLMGGIGADTFVLEAGQGGRQIVADLEPWDRVAFDGFGYSSAAEVRAHLTAVGGDTIFSDQGVVAVFHDTALSDVTADMFVFL